MPIRFDKEPKKTTTGGGSTNNGFDKNFIFMPLWFPLRSAIPANCLALDGQELLIESYQDIYQGLINGLAPTCLEADWQADPLNRSCYVLASSQGKFRLADYNGMATNSIGALFLRGGKGNISTITKDAMQSHKHGMFPLINDVAIKNITGDFSTSAGTSNRDSSISSKLYSSNSQYISISSSTSNAASLGFTTLPYKTGYVQNTDRTNPTIDTNPSVMEVATETVPKHANGLFAIRFK